VHTSRPLLLLWAIAASASGQTVTLNGNMGARHALLVIDGQARVVEVGATVQGVRLISLSTTQAEVDIGGQRRLLVAGASPVRVGGAAANEGAGSGREVVLSAGSGGHFTTQGQINGKGVTFLIDTGATKIALGQPDADRLGIDYKNAPVSYASTANGNVAISAVTLSSVRVGEVEIANVEAVVIPSAMPHVLLGNSFLTRFQMQRDNDTLRLTKR
jgi:aspartyl protease family protein